MQIDISFLIAILSLCLSAVVGLSGLRRNAKHDDKQDASNQAAVLVKLETITSTLAEVKADTRSTRDDMQMIRERLTIVEQSVKSAHHRIDAIDGKERKE